MLISNNINYIKLAIILLEEYSRNISKNKIFEIKSIEIMENLIENFIIFSKEMEIKVK
jgi:hypothetical protein